MRASDVPAGGLDSARLRFELLAPATSGSTTCTFPTRQLPDRACSTPGEPCSRPFKPIAKSAMPNLPGWQARTGYSESSAAATTRLARAPSHRHGQAEPAARPLHEPSALSPDRKRR